MPVAVTTAPSAAPLRKWERPVKTKEDLPWAEIKVLDFSKFDKPGGKAELAEELREAVQTTGFFSLINTGFAPEEVQRQYDIGQSFFDLPNETKNREDFLVDFSRGNYFGYKPAVKRMHDTEVIENVETLNVPKFIPANEGEPHHPHFEQYKGEQEAFGRKAAELGEKVFQLFALILELPENYFASKHAYDVPSEDHLRYMVYHPRPKADDELVRNTWARAHTDFGSLTLLWSQDIAGLQIKTESGEWRYVPPVDNGIICNVGDTIQFWSSGYLKSTVHRVVRPPEDQAHLHRQGLFYFIRPGNDTNIAPVPSPLLQRLGLQKSLPEGQQVVTGLEYVRTRVKNYHDNPSYEDKRGGMFRVGGLEIEDEAA